MFKPSNQTQNMEIKLVHLEYARLRRIGPGKFNRSSTIPLLRFDEKLNLHRGN